MGGTETCKRCGVVLSAPVHDRGDDAYAAAGANSGVANARQFLPIGSGSGLTRPTVPSLLYRTRGAAGH